MPMRLGTVASRIRRPALRLRAGQLLGAANSLSGLARLYGGTDKLAHGYLPYYERHLGPRRFDRMVVFEIGVGGYESRAPTGSLAMWRDFFVRSTIVGLDIEEKEVALGNRVKFERANQADVSELAGVVTRHGAPDVVIDDGSHVGSDIRASFEFLWPKMSSGSVYVIEDLSTSYYPSYGGDNPPPPSSAVGLLTEVADSVQALDVTFEAYPSWGVRADPAYSSVLALHVHPGIAFIVKA